MKGPSPELRARIAGYEYVEDGATQALMAIDRDLREANLDDLEGDPFEVLGAVECWAGLMSYVVASHYAPHSKMRLAGWVDDVPKLLRKMTDMLRTALEWVAGQLQTLSYSISVGFPWGVSVALTWQP